MRGKKLPSYYQEICGPDAPDKFLGTTTAASAVPQAGAAADAILRVAHEQAAAAGATILTDANEGSGRSGYCLDARGRGCRAGGNGTGAP